LRFVKIGNIDALKFFNNLFPIDRVFFQKIPINIVRDQLAYYTIKIHFLKRWNLMLFVRKYDPLIHHRRSIRLRGYDYSKAGRYFITICCQGRESRFGSVKNGKMTLNDAGKMIEKWHLQLPSKFHHIALGQFVVMPNHFHAIIIITDTPNIGADLCVRPDNVHPENARPKNAHPENVRPENAHPEKAGPENTHPENVRPENIIHVRANDPDDPVGADPRVCPESMGEYIIFDRGGHTGQRGGHVGPPLPRIIQWFKTMTTNEYIRGVINLGWERFDGKLWQRNYYERIIRDEKSFIAISKYINNNPANWIDDQFHCH
jgi:REP element-mobilizing transposase RayT